MGAPVVASYTDYEERRLRWLEACRSFPDGCHGAGAEIVRQWVYHSNALEGSPVDQNTTERILADDPPAETPDAHIAEVRDHRHAIALVRELAETDEPLCEGLARRLHNALHEHFRPTQPGERPCTHKSFMHCTSISPELGQRYESFSHWEQFVRSDVFQRFHPIKQAARVHHSLMDLRPFPYGTGKVARLLVNLILLRQGYPPAVFFEEQYAGYYYFSRRSTRRFAQMIADALDASFDVYYQEIPAKFRPYQTKAMDFPADMGVSKRKKASVSTGEPTNPVMEQGEKAGDNR